MKDISVQIIDFNKTSRNYSPQYIVVHDTGDPSATAKDEHDWFSGGNRGASADFFVDSDNIIQIIDTDNYYSWHCGDGHGMYGITNGNSLGIEMCLESDGKPSDKTVENTIELVKYLMDKYSIGIDNVVRHYDASRKPCPNSFNANNWARWWDFKEQLTSETKIGKWILNKDDNKWWYKYNDDTFPKDQWLKIDGKWYLFDIEGYMLYDWKSDEGNWYYLGDCNDGSMKTGWQLIKGKWYYLDSTGAMKKGWLKDGDSWYYLSADGSMSTGWIEFGEKDYCLYSSGQMVSNCDLYGYRFDEHGVAIKLN